MQDETLIPPRAARRRRPQDLVAFAESLARVAAGGGGVPALAAHLAAALDAGVLVEDAQRRALAVAGTGAQPVPPSLRDLLPPDAGGGAVALPPPVTTGARAFPLRAGDAALGWLGVFPPPSRPLDEDRTALARLAAAQLAVEIAREAGGGRRRPFWDRLLARAYDDAAAARDDARARGIALAPAYVAVAVEADGLDEPGAPGENGDVRDVCVATLAKRATDVVALERGAGFIFLVPAPLDVDAANARTAASLIPRALQRAGLDVPVVGGVGRRAEMLHVARSAEEAREAMTIARRLYGVRRIVPYDDLGVYPLLHRGGVTREEWHAFSNRVLAPLRLYDEKHQTELVRTVTLFFDVGQNIKEAAAQLSVHRHTVFYRLRQIGEIARLDLDSPHDQLTLRTALAVDRLERA